MLGERFGRLTVTEFFQRKNSRDFYICMCDCGKETIVELRSLKSGNTKSCGCLRIEASKNRRDSHGRNHEGQD